jgi:uridine kinase
VLRDVLVGSLLIQPDPKTAEPLLLHSMLPQCIRSRESAKSAWVLLLDAQVCVTLSHTLAYTHRHLKMGTGASALMAIRVLLDHGVREDRIIFVTFLVAKDKGVAALENAFPKIRIVTGAVDEELYECWIPGEGYDRDPEEKVKTWVIRPGMGVVGA